MASISCAGTWQKASAKVRKRNRKNHLHFLEKYAKLTKLWHDSDEARGCCPKRQVFRGANVKLGNWRQVTVQINCPRRSEGIDKTWKYPSGKMSHQGEKVPWGICMDAKKHGRKVETTCESFCFSKQDTHGRVYSHRLSYWS